MIDSERLRKLTEDIYGKVNPLVRETQLTLSQCSDIPELEVTYGQNWPIYDRANRQEKLMFLRIIKGAVDELSIKYQYKGNGRPPAFYGDLVKSLLIKSYHNYSSWRTESELRICKAMGIIDDYPKRATINKYMKDTKITRMLFDLLEIIAQPLSLVETDFAADATGISKSYGNTTWKKVRHTPEEEIKRKDYVKLHIITGCKTNVICSAKITKGTSHESPFLPELLEKTSKNFKPVNVCADAGYLSKSNVKAITSIKAKPWIMPKKNVGGGPYNRGPLFGWRAMLYIFKEHQAYFAEHYHQRSNVESTFSSLKRKFGDFCRCKSLETQTNEILCKLVCYNAVILAETFLLEEIKIPFLEVV